MKTEFEGVITFVNPSTLYMDGTTPVGIKMRSPGTDRLLYLKGKNVKIIVLDD